MLDDRAGDADGVAFLERVGADLCRGSLPADDDHRDRVHVRRRDAGDRIRQSGTGGNQRHADFTGSPGKAIGCMDGALLVPYEHMLNGVLLVERVVDVENCAAGIAPEVLNAFGLQCLDQHFSAHEFLCLVAHP